LQIASAPPDARATATALVVRAPAAMPAAASAHADGAQQSSGASVLSEGSMVLSKQMLHGARVIGQVDRKWIAVALGPALALIDQHAADERVQLEALLSKHVGADGLPVHAESVTLEPAEPLALTAHEASLAREHARALELWGWHVRGLGGADAQVLLVRAPSVCSHVLRARALTEYLATLDELGGTAAPPRAVLRAIVSKACRSAIMFGKALSHEECVAVVAQLARVKFPFQCAHGRPTIVPVLEMSAF
jgi:DNA mismatch repair protein MLH3